MRDMIFAALDEILNLGQRTLMRIFQIVLPRVVALHRVIDFVRLGLLLLIIYRFPLLW